jgi:hypothetical protein
VTLVPNRPTPEGRALGAEITHDKRGWPHLDCPAGHPMGWLGSRFWICTKDRNGKGTIWVSSETTTIKRVA